MMEFYHYLHENPTNESNSSSDVDRYETIARISTRPKVVYPLRFKLTLCEAQKQWHGARRLK